MESSTGSLVSLGIAMLPMLAGLKRWSKKRAEERAESAQRDEQEKTADVAESE
jgi:hypothetical protein